MSVGIVDQVRQKIEVARKASQTRLDGCVICPSVKKLQILESLRGGLLMLVRWLALYPSLYFQYNIKNLQRSPWRMGHAGDSLGSGIIVCNHRNGIYDILISQIAAPQWTFFLVDSFFAKIPLWSYFLRLIRGLPVARQGKGRFTPEQRQAFNEITFNKVAENLVQGGWASIFPEGVSQYNHALQPLRPGVAKVALLAEEKAGWDLQLKIFVLGLNYENQFTGRSNVYAQWAEPIDVRVYREAFKLSPEAAEKALLQDVQAALKACTIEAPDTRKLEEAHQLASHRGERHFHGVRRALEDVITGRASPESQAKKSLRPDKNESYLYQAVGIGLWAVMAVVGWPFRVFGRLCASDLADEAVYMQLLWWLCFIVGGIVSGHEWIIAQFIVTWLACVSWLWAWRRGMVPSRVNRETSEEISAHCEPKL